MKKFLVIVLCLSMVVSLAACVSKPAPASPAAEAPAAEAPTVETAVETPGAEGITYPTMTIKLAHDAPLETPHHEACIKIKEELEAASNGSITVEVYPLQQLGSAREMIESMQMNSIEMVLLPTSKYGGFLPSLNIMDMPFLFPTQESSMNLFKSELATELMADLEEIGIHGNAFYSSGARNFTNNKQVRTPDDFKGMKIRTQEAPIIMKMYESWGATPVAIDIMELYNALQQKTVDGQENPFLSIASMKLYEVQNFMCTSGHSYLEYIMCSSLKWWDGLDANTQTLIQDTIVKNQQFCYDRLQEYNDKYLATIKTGNIQIYDLTPEERQAFVDASKPVYEMFKSDIDPDLFQRILDFLADPANH